ncbi:hypothetical protein V6N13_085470 [Hibiscus sabdariffa]
MRVEERRGFSSSYRSIDEFCEFVNAATLCDIPSQGKAFTWFGHRNKCSRIDRFFVSADWFIRFERLMVVNLPRELSDHALIVLVSDTNDSGPKPFHFFNAWLRNPQHVREMECAWKGLRQGEVTDSLVCKLREMKRVLKVWNRDSFRNVDVNYRELVDELEQLDTKLGVVSLTTLIYRINVI